MSQSVSVVHAKIERVVWRPWKSSRRSANFQLLDGRVLCHAWIEDDAPIIGIRQAVADPELAMTIGVAIQMAIDWLVEELAE
jgi:hypothetical protein